MSKLIKKGTIVDNTWQVVRLAEGESPADVALPATPALLPLAVWLARRDEILVRGESASQYGVWLAAGEDPQAITGDLAHLSVIAVDFPKFTDGRGYSTARLLRERHGFQAEIRAIGDVLRDQLYFMKRCGIDAYALRADQDVEAALAGLADFSESYQAAVDQPQPLFRRRGVAA